MAYLNKIDLLVLNSDGTKFLVCEKSPENVTPDFIMPGGLFEETSEIECLKNEIKEELGCDVDAGSLGFVGEYIDAAAGKPDKDVLIRLYSGKNAGEPKPSAEIKRIHWIGRENANNPRVSLIIRNKIIPDLAKRKILN